MKLTFSNFILLGVLFFVIQMISSSYAGAESDHVREDEAINAWHEAAAVGDSAAFFSMMTENAVYLGTDESERWDKTSMGKDLGKYFNGKRAWKFIPYNRIYTELEDKNSILFDECLRTWMGPCKATGILTKEKGNWKISYYNLSVAVPNDNVKDYTKLLPPGKILKD